MDSPGGFGIHDHACWLHAAGEDFRPAAIRYLEEGRRAGARLIYVGGGSEERLREDLAELEDRDRLLDDGTLVIRSQAAMYRAIEQCDPTAQVGAYAEATEGALRDGHTGIRVAGEATGLVADPDRWEAFRRYEMLIDRYMAAHPMGAACFYDREALSEQVVRELAAIHPAARATPEIAPFHLFSQPGGLALAGEVDHFSADALTELLRLAPRDGSPTVLDLSALSFIDHHGIIALAKFGFELSGQGNRLETHNMPRMAARICELIEVDL